MEKKKLGAAALVLLIAYFLVLPSVGLWSEPDVTAHVPATWAHDEDMPIELTVSTWHSNYQIALVRFHPDYHDSDLQGDTGPMYPQPLLQEQRSRYWSAFSLNRFTFPRSAHHELEVPLSELAGKGNSAPGVLRGEIEIMILHAGNIGSHDGAVRTHSRQLNDRIPFEIRLF